MEKKLNKSSSFTLIFLKTSLSKISNYEIFQTYRKVEIGHCVYHLHLINIKYYNYFRSIEKK